MDSRDLLICPPAAFFSRLVGQSSQTGQRLRDQLRSRGAARNIGIHLHNLVEGIDAVEERRQVLRGRVCGLGSLGTPVHFVVKLLQGPHVRHGWDSTEAGAGTEGDEGLALLPHFPQDVFFFFVADASADDPDIRLGNLQLGPFARLPEVLMVHQDRHVHKLESRQKVEERFPDVEDGDLTPSADVEPLFSYFYGHFVPPR
jgi:hypothetical protein